MEERPLSRSRDVSAGRSVSNSASSAPTKPLIRVLHGEVLDPPPFWFMRQAGRYLPEYRAVRAQAKDFIALCLDPVLAAEITLQPVRRYGMDAAILFADILLVPHALGQDIAFVEGQGPKLAPVRDGRDVDRLQRAADGAVERLAPVYETVRRVRTGLPPQTALIGFAGAPWTVATYMVEGGGGHDFAIVRRWAYGDPDSFQVLIDLLVDTTVRYLEAQIEAGAEALQLFDTWAGILDAAGFQRWCVAPVRAIVERLRVRHPSIPVIAFPRGAGVGYRDYATATGVAAVGLDPSVPPEWAAAELQPAAAVQGNLDPQLLVVGGEPMLAAVDRILAALGGGPFIFNLGHGIVPETPPENVAALCERLRSDNGRPPAGSTAR